MADIIRFMDMDIDADRLPSRETVMSILRTYGATFGSLELVTKEHLKEFGKELIWRYPLCDGNHAGGIIVPVQEGFLWLPYDEMDSEDYEILLLEDARLLDADACTFLLIELRAFMGGLLNVVEDIRRLTAPEHDENADCDDQCVGCERACADRIEVTASGGKAARIEGAPDGTSIAAMVFRHGGNDFSVWYPEIPNTDVLLNALLDRHAHRGSSVRGDAADIIVDISGTLVEGIAADTIPKLELGAFVVGSGRLTVSDPCYKPGTWCMGEVENVRNGKWLATAFYTDQRVAKLRIRHENCPPDDELKASPAPFDVGVDSGQAGFFDSAHYRDSSVFPDGKQDDADLWYDHCCEVTLTSNQAGVIPFGAVSSSGYGDGGYECVQYAAADGEIVKAEIVFIPDDEDCDEEA